ncbi:hypothetical protein BLA23254_05719 [Burkholderia lata]|uniref:Uncharacterized protein n=1 Tax=Burkholderia lata (strain ATCC 17760 / DSM 23089 / LMG 22485 / NCIMB 9086 / R18194 / 383) TaxID=482957 RepID=A0A6P2Q9Y4_BURL3|nr:hypothetical protein [Burkholderia lata]VWC19511.1 hypothetical protein BLA23254_05719 [Burkholderia lata]
MWFLLVLYVLPAAYAASKVGPHYGFLAGCAALAAVLATQTALLTWGTAWVKRRRGAIEPPEATASPVATDSLEDEPADEPGDEPDVLLRYGEQARFKQLVLIADAARPEVTRRFYDKAKRAIEAYVDVETGRDGSAAAMVSTADLAPAEGLSAVPPDETLTVFVSNDGAWSGFRVGDDSFRFRHGAITRLRFTHVMPVRWNGDYMVTFWFDVPKRERATDYNAYSTWFDIGVDRAGRRSRMLPLAFREIASVLDVAFDVDEVGDD